MSEGVSFDEDGNLGLPKRKFAKDGGGWLIGLVMKLGLAKSVQQANLVLLVACVVIVGITLFILMSGGGASSSVRFTPDPTDPVLKDRTN